MAAAFDRAGFDAYDVHMSDLAAGRRSLAEFKGFVAVRRLLLRRRARRRRRLGQVDPVQRQRCATISPRSSRGRTSFALGVCNGCQMMGNLRDLIPGAAHWPHFVRNRSEQFEARFVHGRGHAVVRRCSSRAWRAAVIPVATAHGEGFAEFHDQAALAAAQPLVALRFVDNRGAATETSIPITPTGRRRASPVSRRRTAGSRS